MQPVKEEVVEKLSPPREWRDNTGKFRTRAELTTVTPEYVLLKKADGKFAKVPWHRLCDEDQEFVKRWQANR